MIQKGLHIMERLHRLLDLHERMQQPCFTHLIEPMYRDAEDVVRDYTSLHLDLIEQLYTHSEAVAVITWLEVYRMKCLPLYMLVRNFDPEAQIESQYGRHPIVAFQNNMLSLMQRCLFLVEQEKLRVAADRHQELSILTQLYLNYHEPLPPHRPFYVEMAKQQWQAVQAIWEEVVECYAVIKLQCRAVAPQVSSTPGCRCSTPLDGSAGE
jgi:hypothetical protein